jgi:hypothetical protein
MKQRDFMRNLCKQHGDQRELLIEMYAVAEQKGLVPRKSNTHGWTANQYAAALYRDGKRWGWIFGKSQQERTT